jgi:hypothetical protein
MELLSWVPSASCPTPADPSQSGNQLLSRCRPVACASPQNASICFPEFSGRMGEGFLRLTHQDSDEYNDLAAASLRGKMDSRNLWRPSFLA